MHKYFRDRVLITVKLQYYRVYNREKKLLGGFLHINQ